ncbi:MAG: DinB family protein [Ignavibacteriaceae bacterium]|nr:DinB family protein [Ignavibacteriaceae bacterium]
MISEVEKLAEFAEAVRESTIERLKKVPAGKENWRITADAMSIAEIAYHVIEADDWLFLKVDNPKLEPMLGKIGTIKINDVFEFRNLIERLQQSGQKRCSFIKNIEGSKLKSTIFDKRFGKEVSIWWIIIRGNLDHEIHHRGQLAAYLRALS